jgi:hypothetical protein
MVEQLIQLFIVLVGGIAAYNLARNPRPKLTRSALLPPSRAAWRKLYHHGDAASFLNLTGFTRPAFKTLLRIVFPENDTGVNRRGRPQLLDPKDKLGMLCIYMNSRMDVKHLCLIFGVVPTTCSDTVEHMVVRVIKYLKNNPLSRIKFPTDDEMKVMAWRVQTREPSINNVIGFVDGLSIPVQCSESEEAQAADYNGYGHDTRCNNVFAFSSFGKIIYAVLNAPGSWHDSQVAIPLCTKVIQSIGSYALCVDKGFSRTGEMFDRFVGPISRKAAAKLSPILRDAILEQANTYTSLRQASEWGMKALQGSFSRLKSRLSSNQNKRYNIIMCVALLHNFRTEVLGVNQIATVFNPEYEQFINLEGYDRIARYFYNEDNIDVEYDFEDEDD